MAKEFVSADHVHPLLFTDGNSIFKVDPNPTVMILGLSFPLPKNEAVKPIYSSIIKMKDESVIIAETPRVIIRHFCTENFADLAPILANPEVMKYSLAGVLSSNQTRKFIQKMLCRYESEGYGYYAIIDRHNTQLIGYCGLLFCLIEGSRKVEIGYRLDPHYWQKGLATEAATAVRDYAFNQLSLNDLIALIQPKNIASIKVAEKIGMKFERNYTFSGMPVKIYRIFKP